MTQVNDRLVSVNRVLLQLIVLWFSGILAGRRRYSRGGSGYYLELLHLQRSIEFGICARWFLVQLAA